MAMGGRGKEVFSFDKWVPITVVSSNQAWTLCVGQAILAPNLCVPLLVGNPFLATNGIVIDHELHTCIDKKSGYDLLNLPALKCTTVKPRPHFRPKLRKAKKSVITDITTLFPKTCEQLNETAKDLNPCPMAMIRTHMEHIMTDEVLKWKDAQFKE